MLELHASQGGLCAYMIRIELRDELRELIKAIGVLVDKFAIHGARGD
jgi:hypothetical protein